MRATRPVLILLPFLLGADCGRRAPEPAGRPVVETPVHQDPWATGLQLALSPGSPAAGAAERPPAAAATPLNDATTQALLARLPALEPSTPAQAALPAASPPAPRPGHTAQAPFPPPPGVLAPEAPPAGPLQVLRWQPEGPVPLAPSVAITFDRPMVPLTSQPLAAAHVPVQLDPQPPGAWRWVGARTLVFEPEAARLPAATAYTLTVPVGAAAADGTALAAPFQATFRTPPPSLRAHSHGSTPAALSPVVALVFDQAVRPAAILSVLQVQADRRDVPVRLATSAEVQADPHARELLREAPPERVVAVVPRAPLPRSARVTVTLPAGTPSAEGPLPTTGATSFGFETHGPLALQGHQCGYDARCRPGWPLELVFTNPLDPAADLDALVQVTPPIPELTHHVAGQRVVLQGATAARTAYRVTVAPGLRDAFGQELDAPVHATFAVGPAEPAWPMITPSGGELQVPDPFGPPGAAFVVQGMAKARVRVAVAPPEAWWARFEGGGWRRHDAPLPGEVVLDEVRPLAGDPDLPSLLEVDLAPHHRPGALLVVEVESPPGTPEARRRRAQAWVQPTRLGLSAFADAAHTWIATTDLQTGAPLAGVAVAQGARPLGVTDARGLLRVEPLDPHGGLPLVARLGDDLALLPAGAQPGPWGAWSPGPEGVRGAWFVFDDRGIYRPGEVAHVKGWLRPIDLSAGGDLLPPRARPGAEVAWVLSDARGVELGRGEVPLDPLGGFAIHLALPEATNLGHAHLRLSSGDASTAHALRVEAFRRPEYEVTARVETAAPHVVSGEAVLAAQAAYYAGGALPGAPTTWSVTTRPASWRPPGWDAFHFGQVDLPWWRGWSPPANTTHHELSGVTDASGVHRLRLGFLAAHPPRPSTVTARAVVTDVQRQAWAASTSLLVHPAGVYAGVKTSRAFYEADRPIDLQVVAVDLDGAPAAGREVQVALVRTRPVWRAGAWTEEEAERHTCEVTSGAAPQGCTFQPRAGGRFELTATLTDAQGRPNRTTLPVWVAGGAALPTSQGVEQQQVTLVPDAERYAPGEVAEVLVQAPFAPASGVVTWRRSGIVHLEHVQLDGPTTTLRIPVEEGHTPGLVVQVDLFGQAPRTDDRGRPLEGPPRPAYATGQLELAVPPLFRALAVEVAPEVDEASPGASTGIDVVVRGADGAPVADAQVAVVVVDEAVLALTGHTIPDPLHAFHPQRPPGALDHHNRALVRLPDPLRPAGEVADVADGDVRLEVAMPASAPRMRKAVGEVAFAAAGAAPAPSEPPIALRADLRPDALFLPAVPTDADGRARVPLTLPDNLTRYRITAVAVDDGRRFGRGEADLTVRLPLMVRPSPPRFLNFGDEAELPVVLQNQTSAPLVVDVALRSDDLAVAGGRQAGRRATVPAHDRVEVRFPVTTVRPGAAVAQVAAVAGPHADAARIELPVFTPATAEAFATYGSLDGPPGPQVLAQPLQVPDDVLPQVGGLEITTSTTALQGLTDAVLALTSHPYDAVEPLASRVLAVAALRDVLAAFQTEQLPPPAALEAAVARDLDALAARQRPDGAWGYWHGRSDPAVFPTLHAVHALVRARHHGFAPSDEALQRGLRRIEQLDPLFDVHWSPAARRAARSYALMIRRLAGQDVAGEAAAVVREAGGVEEVPLEALGWLLPSLPEPTRAAALRHLGNRATETAATAGWATSYGEEERAVLLHGDRRTDAVLLDALLQVAPAHDLLPKVAAGLLAHRVQGRWSTTQDNVWVLLALRRYFDVAEGTPPDLVARAWVGERFAGERAFRGRTAERAHLAVPMPWLTEHHPGGLTLAREGAGRLYYRLGLRYAPASLHLPPAEHGFSVTRTYEGADDPADVQREADGTWRVRAGARVRVEVTMVAPARRYHVALVDPLPAGLEPLHPGLAVTEALPPDADAPEGWWWGPWYGHENLRDERVEAFATLLPAGVWTYRYVARATTPGSFVVPPARAEEQYHPETFGRTGTDRVVVTP